MKNKFKVICMLTLVLLWGVASVATAASMGGMDMGGGSNKSSAASTSKATETKSADNMQDMNQAQSKPAEHDKTTGMDDNMPGMKADSSKSADGHGEGEEDASTGVNWYVVGGFLGINSLVIGAAGLLKLKVIGIL